jgi:trehalose 6-phosphate synthase/phosphatase
MNPILRDNGGDWIGWAGSSGEEDQEERNSVLQEWAQKDQCFAVELPAEIAKGFYEGYSNQTLWPVFHNFPSQLKFDAKDWQAYIEANRIFCRAVVDRYKQGDLVWVHDYQLMLLPQMLRAELPDAAIGFFLHPATAGRTSPRSTGSGPCGLSDPWTPTAIPGCPAPCTRPRKQNR